MAKTLSKTGITDSSTIEAWHVTQSIDALKGTDAYDITISGSLNLTGSVTTGSFTGDGSGLTGITAEWDGTHVGDAQITGSLVVTQNITGSNISASGYISASSFSGDGSNLTGISAGFWTGSSGTITRQSDVQISGSLFVSGSSSGRSIFGGLDGVDGIGADQKITIASQNSSTASLELRSANFAWEIGTSKLRDPGQAGLIFQHDAGGGSFSDKVIFDTSGNVGIGVIQTTLPERLTVSGNISASGYLTATNITASGNISASGNVSGVSGSFSHVTGNSPLTISSDLLTIKGGVQNLKCCNVSHCITASIFSGSHQGDGSQLTNLPSDPISNSSPILGRYSPDSTQGNTTFVFNSIASFTFNLPRETGWTSDYYPIGTRFKVMNIGAGTTTIGREHSSVTFYRSGSAASTDFDIEQYEVTNIEKIAGTTTPTWICYP